jgi:hypothetical protein
MARITTHPKAWDAGYADALAGRPHGTDPLNQVDELAHASGYVEGRRPPTAKDGCQTSPGTPTDAEKAFIGTQGFGAAAVV